MFLILSFSTKALWMKKRKVGSNITIRPMYNHDLLTYFS